jgi:hypothetical protein
MKLAPRAQKDLLCKIVYVPGRHPRQENGMYHAEEPAVQFAKRAFVASARGADHLPQFTRLAGYDVLLLRAFGSRGLSEVGLRPKPDP